jgi:hypothetical protein
MLLTSSQMQDFKSSDEQKHRQFMRLQVRKAKISNNERAIITALMNVWFANKCKGHMHPGRKKIAKMAHVSIRTVASMMARMREAGALVVVSHANGGRASTRYRMDLEKLILFMGYKLPKVIRGALTEIVRVVGGFVPFELWKKRANIAHGKENKRKVIAPCGYPEPLPDKNDYDFGGQAYA